MLSKELAFSEKSHGLPGREWSCTGEVLHDKASDEL